MIYELKVVSADGHPMKTEFYATTGSQAYWIEQTTLDFARSKTAHQLIELDYKLDLPPPALNS